MFTMMCTTSEQFITGKAATVLEKCLVIWLQDGVRLLYLCKCGRHLSHWF